MYFFSSRRRHTRWPRDWSSDVCSSDLEYPVAVVTAAGKAPLTAEHEAAIDPLYLADRHIGRREQYAGVFAPDILGGTEIGRASCRERGKMWVGERSGYNRSREERHDRC